MLAVWRSHSRNTFHVGGWVTECVVPDYVFMFVCVVVLRIHMGGGRGGLYRIVSALSCVCTLSHNTKIRTYHRGLLYDVNVCSCLNCLSFLFWVYVHMRVVCRNGTGPSSVSFVVTAPMFV